MTEATKHDDTLAVISQAQCLLLDFDGPICGVFATHTAPTVARHLLDGIQLDDLPPDVAAMTSPTAVLDFAVTLGTDHARRIEAELTRHEVIAIDGASPTSGVDEVMRRARQCGTPVAIVSNNSASAIEKYLDVHALTSYVQAVSARTPDNVDRLKPHPFLLLEATSASGSTPETAVFVGDQVSDIVAGQAAHIPVVGYANKPGKTQAFTAANATAIIDDMHAVAHAIGRLA